MKKCVIFVMECEENKQNSLIGAVKMFFEQFPQGRLIAIKSGKPKRAIYFLCKQLIEQNLLEKSVFFQMYSVGVLESDNLLKLNPEKEG